MANNRCLINRLNGLLQEAGNKNRFRGTILHSWNYYCFRGNITAFREILMLSENYYCCFRGITAFGELLLLSGNCCFRGLLLLSGNYCFRVLLLLSGNQYCLRRTVASRKGENFLENFPASSFFTMQ